MALAAALLLGGPPAAAQDAAAIQAIQKQIQQLQAELRKLQADAAKRDAALKQAQEQTRQAQEQARQAREEATAARAFVAGTTGRSPTAAPATTPASGPAATLAVPTVAAPAATALTAAVPRAAAPAAAVMTIPPNDTDASGQPIYNPDKPNGKFDLGGVTVTLGGFIDLTGYYRSRNETRGVTSSFSDIPFAGPTPQGDSGEFNMTAQNTRLSVRVDGKVSGNSMITGYVESDFNNGAGGANSVQSNSYTPRLRQAFAEYTDDSWQAYALAGQAWSLATPFKKGLDPFQTWQPPTIDTAYVVGYDFLRVPVFRVVKGFGPAWFGLEIDAPQTVFGGSSVAPAGGAVYTSFAGNGGLNPQANYSVNSVPDLIGKTAVDTDFGHYEVFGVLRQFQDQVSCPGPMRPIAPARPATSPPPAAASVRRRLFR